MWSRRVRSNLVSVEVNPKTFPRNRPALIILGSWSRAIEACVKEAQADGSLRRDLDAKSMAAFMLNSWEGAVLRSKVDRSDAALVAFEKIVFGSLAK